MSSGPTDRGLHCEKVFDAYAAGINLGTAIVPMSFAGGVIR